MNTMNSMFGEPLIEISEQGENYDIKICYLINI